MVWQDGGLGADCSGLHNSPGLPGLFLRSRSHTTSSEYWLFSFPLWPLLTVQWPNKGNQICFYLDVSRHSVRFREHLRRSLFQGGGFLQYHRASVCWSMCTSTTALGIMSWTELKQRNGSPAVSDHTVWELPKTPGAQRLRRCPVLLEQTVQAASVSLCSTADWCALHPICVLDHLTGRFRSFITSPGFGKVINSHLQFVDRREGTFRLIRKFGIRMLKEMEKPFLLEVNTCVIGGWDEAYLS